MKKLLLLLLFITACSQPKGSTPSEQNAAKETPAPVPSAEDCKLHSSCEDVLRNLSLYQLQLIQSEFVRQQTQNDDNIFRAAILSEVICNTLGVTHIHLNKSSATFLTIFKHLTSEAVNLEKLQKQL